MRVVTPEEFRIEAAYVRETARHLSLGTPAVSLILEAEALEWQAELLEAILLEGGAAPVAPQDGGTLGPTGQ